MAHKLGPFPGKLERTFKHMSHPHDGALFFGNGEYSRALSPLEQPVIPPHTMVEGKKIRAGNARPKALRQPGLPYPSTGKAEGKEKKSVVSVNP